MFAYNTKTVYKILRYYCNYTSIKDINLGRSGEKAGIKGWVKNIRRMKNYSFIEVNDGSTYDNFQVVLPKTNVSKVTIGDSIETLGVIEKSPKGSFELRAEYLNVIGAGRISEGFPFASNQTYPPEYLRSYLHLRSRLQNFNAVLRIRHKATKAFNDYMERKNFLHIHTPILTSNDCEGGGEVFRVKPENDELIKNMSKSNIPHDYAYFDKNVFLTVSSQLHLEAMCHGLGNTYTFMPVFRAENSKSHLHLCEFYMLEAEMAFLTDIKELTNFIELMIKEVTQQLISECKTELEQLMKKNFSSEFDWIETDWDIITYEDAFSILEKNKHKLKTFLKLNDGFSKEQELYLVKYFKKPIFIIDWPALIKPFYAKAISDKKVAAVDLIVPEVGEIVGGSLRENKIEHLQNTIPNGLDWYIDIRKFGGIPTGGFGMGFERYLQLITGIKNIKDVIPFPRWPHNCSM